MTLRNVLVSLVASLASVAPALAQPGTKPPAPAPTAKADELAAFEQELDALFPGRGLTADEAARRAIKTSPTVTRAVADIEVAIAEAKAAEVVRIPIVGVNAQYSRLSSIETPVFGMPGMGFEFPVVLNVYELNARVAVTVSDYFSRFPKIIEAARLGEEAARLTRRSTEINVGQDARVAYYEWVRSKLQVLIARRQLAQVRTTVAQVRALAEVQRVSRAELMRVESNEAVAEQTLTQLEYLSRLREEQLRILIGAPSSEPLAVGEDIRTDLAVSAAGDLDELYKVARSQRIDFRVLDVGIEAREQQREGERAGLYPKLGVFGQASFANPNQRIFPQEEEFHLTWAVGAQITWTLNDALISSTQIDKIKGFANGLRADLESLSRGTRVQILAAQQAVAVAQAALETSKKGLAAAEEGYRVRRELLNAERATAVELVDAETELTRARIAALNARVDLRVALTQLSHALGNDAK